MSKVLIVDDFPENFGGAEIVNETVRDHLGLNRIIAASEVVTIDKDKTYLLCNTSTMTQKTLDEFSEIGNYAILEHDYKIVASRHPWRYKDNIVPEQDKINLDLYRNAKAVFVQTEDHLNIFNINDVEGNFINLDCSIWSEKELSTLEKYRIEKADKTADFCVVESINWIKNQEGAEKFLKESKVSYRLLPATTDRESFIRSMARFACLVFFPIARESCCRLIVEAKCLGMNVLTTPNSGAWQADWYDMQGMKLIQYLRKQSRKNLELITEVLCK